MSEKRMENNIGISMVTLSLQIEVFAFKIESVNYPGLVSLLPCLMMRPCDLRCHLVGHFHARKNCELSLNRDSFLRHCCHIFLCHSSLLSIKLCCCSSMLEKSFCFLMLKFLVLNFLELKKTSPHRAFVLLCQQHHHLIVCAHPKMTVRMMM